MANLLAALAVKAVISRLFNLYSAAVKWQNFFSIGETIFLPDGGILSAARDIHPNTELHRALPSDQAAGSFSCFYKL